MIQAVPSVMITLQRDASSLPPPHPSLENDIPGGNTSKRQGKDLHTFQIGQRRNFQLVFQSKCSKKREVRGLELSHLRIFRGFL